MGRFLHCDEPLDRFRRSSPFASLLAGNRIRKFRPRRSRNSQHLPRHLFSRTFFPAFPLGPMKFYHREQRMMEQRFEDSRFQLPLFFSSSSSSPPFFSPFRRCARVTRIPNFLIVARRRETARKPERSFVPRQLQLSPAEPLAFNEVGRLTT